MFDDSQLVKHFPAMLKALRIRIAGLPESLPLASSDGPLARYFGDLEIDVEEGARYTANRQWERAFQVSKEEQQNRIARGKYGMDLVCPFLEFYSRQEGIRDTDGVGMLARRIRDLNSILDALPNATPGGSVSATNFFAPRTKPATRAPTVPAKRPADSDEDDANDKTYRPPRHTPVQSEEESESEITVLDGLSDARSSMAATTAANTVVTKELLNAGFGEGVDFLEGITIH
ncbi:hypothetical protein R3P38DRAFT_2697455 [Favolaschia claudopus]|uniref:Uncharacterized protein n=1 Tax=Favolaschia claudopus TaxID=2862362 RepID=A0AAW0CDP9_9AGAR